MKINNELWNGKDATFIRCVNSNSLEYFDVPIANGISIEMYEKIWNMAHNLKHSNGIVSGDYIEYDFWFIISVVGGEVLGKWDDEEKAFGGVPSSPYEGFWFDFKTFNIISVCERLYESYTQKGGFINNTPTGEAVCEYIKGFNDKISVKI